MKKIKRQSLVSLLFAGIMFITTAAAIVRIPAIGDITFTSDTSGNVTFRVKCSNTCTLSIYEQISSDSLDHLIDIDVTETDSLMEVSATVSGFCEGLHTFRLVAKNSDGDLTFTDPLHVYVNRINE